MSIECNNTTPLASGAGAGDGGLLKEDSSALVDAILDLQKLANESASSLNNSNRNSLVALTKGLNNILLNSVIDDYPRVKDRVEENAGVSVTDIADFVGNNNLNAEELLEAVTEYNDTSTTLADAKKSGSGGSGDGQDDTDAAANLSNSIDGLLGKGSVQSHLQVDSGSGLTNINGTVGSEESDIGLSTSDFPDGSGGTGTGTGANGTGTGTGTGGGSGVIGSAGLGSGDTTGINLETDTSIGTGGTGVGGTGVGGTGVGTIGGIGTGDGGAFSGAGSTTTSGGGTGVGATGLQGTIGGVTGGTSGVNPNALNQLGATAPGLTYNQSVGLSISDKAALLGLGGTVSIFPTIIANLLGDLDFHLASNIGQDLTGKLCGAYNDILEDLTKVFAVVKAGKALLSQVENLLEKDVKKLAESIKQKGILQTLLDILKQIIEEAVNAARKAATAAIAAVLGAVYGVAKASMAVMKKAGKILQDIQNYMQSATVRGMIEDMEKLVAELASSFERLTPENIANLMFRLCQMARDLQMILMAPAIKMQRFAGSLFSESAVLKSQNAVNTQKAVKYGALRVSDEDRKAKKDKIIAKQQSTPPSNREADYLTNEGITQEEMSDILALQGNPEATFLTPQITFSSKVISNKEFQNLSDKLLARVIRVQKQTGHSYEIISGRTKKSGNPKRMGAIGNTIHNTGYAVDIKVTEAQRDDTIVAASRAGITGIGVYKSHIHLDTSARRSWVSGYSGQALVDIKQLTEKHDIDGFRKKRS